MLNDYWDNCVFVYIIPSRKEKQQNKTGKQQSKMNQKKIAQINKITVTMRVILTVIMFNQAHTENALRA